MNARTIRSLLALTIAGVALPLAGAGAAYADDDTQDFSQGADATQESADTASDSVTDARNGDNRPDGANGLESEFFQFDPRFLEGPVGGLLKNGPQE